MKKIFFLYITLFIFHFSPSAQHTVIHFDKPIHFSGEPVFYSLSAPKGTFPDNTIAKIEFHSKNGLIEHHFHQFEEDNIHGTWKSSYNLTSDVYLLKVIVFDEDDQKEILINKAFLPIYNDSELKALKDISTSNSDVKMDSERDVLMVPNMEAQAFVQGEKVNFTIDNLTGLKGQKVSVTIRENSLSHGYRNIFYENIPFSDQIRLMDKIPLQGKRTLLKPTKLDNPLLFAIIPDDLKFSGAMVREESFYMKLPVFSGVKKIQFFDLLNVPLKISPDPLNRLDTFNYPPLIVNAEILKSIEEFKTRKLIYSIFNEVETNVQSIIYGKNEAVIKPDFEVNIADYAMKGSLADFFKEVFTPLKFSKNKNDQFEARVMYEQGGLKKYYENKAIFVINGVATTDDHYVGSLPVHTIKSMVIYSDFDKLVNAFGRGALSGLIKIEMLDPSYIMPSAYSLPYLEVIGLQESKMYPITIDTQSKAPKFKSLVYWNPTHLVDDFGNLNIQFNAPSDIGHFIIEVVTQASEKNKLIEQYPIQIIPDSGQ